MQEVNLVFSEMLYFEIEEEVSSWRRSNPKIEFQVDKISSILSAYQGMGSEHAKI